MRFFTVNSSTRQISVVFASMLDNTCILPMFAGWFSASITRHWCWRSPCRHHSPMTNQTRTPAARLVHSPRELTVTYSISNNLTELQVYIAVYRGSNGWCTGADSATKDDTVRPSQSALVLRAVHRHDSSIQHGRRGPRFVCVTCTTSKLILFQCVFVLSRW